MFEQLKKTDDMIQYEKGMEMGEHSVLIFLMQLCSQLFSNAGKKDNINLEKAKSFWAERRTKMDS